jgi:kynurenine formamidase
MKARLRFGRSRKFWPQKDSSILRMNSHPVFLIGPVFQMKCVKQFIGMTNVLTRGARDFSRRCSHTSGNGGTHVDPPAHFVKGLRTVDQIDPKEMILPLVVVDVHEECAKNPDYTLSLERVKRWETDHGQVPPGAFVAMRSDWSKRWPDADKMANKDANGAAHYPGWSLPVLKHLYEERKITASGHETTDTDPGIATTKDDYSLETYVLSTNHYQIELLTNLDKVPESGAIVVVSFPKPKGGSGFPARAFAILP